MPWPLLAAFGAKLAAGAGTAIGAAGGAAIGGKIFGSMNNKQDKQRMDTMYPGTTPWERLGGGGGGVPQSSAAERSSTKQASAAVTSQKMANQTSIKQTQMNNDAAVKVAEIQSGHSVGLRQSEANRNKSQTALNVQQTKRSIEDTGYLIAKRKGVNLDNISKTATSSLAQSMAEANLSAIQTKTIWSSTWNALNNGIPWEKIKSNANSIMRNMENSKKHRKNRGPNPSDNLRRPPPPSSKHSPKRSSGNTPVYGAW